MDHDTDDYGALPPRREKHGSKKNLDETAAAISLDHTEKKQEKQSFIQIQQEMNSRLERRKALKEFTLNPQGYSKKSAKPKVEKEVKVKKKRKRKKWSGGLIAANIILVLFLLLIAGIFFTILYKFY